ncbi:MAG: hypothetical protein PUH02_00505 [bacterium]|nr:hypothetical protein [bacterium]
MEERCESMQCLAAGRMVASPEAILIIVIIAVIGYGIVSFVANKKWGYSRKREEELEEETDISMQRKKEL